MTAARQSYFAELAGKYHWYHWYHWCYCLREHNVAKPNIMKLGKESDTHGVKR